MMKIVVKRNGKHLIKNLTKTGNRQFDKMGYKESFKNFLSERNIKQFSNNELEVDKINKTMIFIMSD